MSNRFTVMTRMRGAYHTDKDFVAFYFDLHFGHKYRLFPVNWSIEKNYFKDSEKVHCSPLAGKGTLNVNVSSNVSDLYLQPRHVI